ncbi:MAG: DNA starvation/stationary phase protection protein [Chitinophagaceae bacterium]
MKANIGISDKNLQEVAKLLNTLLSDETVLYIKTRNYHWNIEGDNFIELHKLYESQYKELEEIIDEVAERIRYLGHYAEARLKDFIKTTRLAEEDYTSDQKVQLKNLLSDHESIIIHVRGEIDVIGEKYKDAGTADFITGIMKQHEKIAWFIRSYLK